MKRKAPVKKNEELMITIEDVSAEGEGIGRYEGYTLFVPKTLPQEVVKVKVLKAGGSFGYAKTLDFLKTSPLRQEPDCPAGPLCGGCTLQHIRYEETLKLKQKQIKDCLERIGGLTDVSVPPVLGMVDPTRYRNKMQYPIRTGKDGEVQIGFFAPASHRVIEAPVCCQQDEWVGVILQKIKEMMKNGGFTAYDEERHTGLLRHCVIRKSDLYQNFHLTLVVNESKMTERLAQAIRQTFAGLSQISGVSINFHNEKNNVIMGRKTEAVLGELYVEDHIGRYRFLISPNSFFQINSVMTERLYQTALEYAALTGNERVIDLYCGIGTISLFLAEKAKEVIGVEIVPEAIADAEKNAVRNGVQNARFYAGKAEEIFPRLYAEGKRAEVIVVDPPRKGLEESVVETLRHMQPERIVYVSCNPATLARDIKRLAAADTDGARYQLAKVQGLDMFARGGHVETVALLSKLDVDKHIDVEIKLDELDLTSAESKATYAQIKKYILEKFDLKVSTLYIAQIKKKCGIVLREHYNKSKKEKQVIPQCTPEKEEAIMDALRHFKMI
ncbi:23S rRNA (uracil(1939)-C(5))-methyltransferase RlmD [Lachnospiraceae bacterium oral taxon 500]|nr:23S rRNA (uracil(1939)-C(5))-methyltransferase RlmD [Lachnospiraceae bacterium oral taxon 500]